MQVFIVTGRKFSDSLHNLRRHMITSFKTETLSESLKIKIFICWVLFKNDAVSIPDVSSLLQIYKNDI